MVKNERSGEVDTDHAIEDLCRVVVSSLVEQVQGALRRCLAELGAVALRQDSVQ